MDHDTVSLSNLNRQIIATRDSVGEYKTDVMKRRILSINPKAQVEVYHDFFLPGMDADFLPFTRYSYVVDAIDTVSAKIELAFRAEQEGFWLISSMGTGNKLDPSRFKVADIYETKVCPLAKVMRKELRARGIEKLKVVYSEEEPMTPKVQLKEGKRRAIPGSVAFVPGAAGLVIAGEVVKDLMDELYSFTQIYRYDDALNQIINEEAAAFFAGQKSAKDVAGIIQSRAQIYVNETR